MTSSLQSAISEQHWMKKHATLPPDAIALFSFLLGVANGRTQFTASITDLRKMTSRLSHDRFLELARKLESEGLIQMDWSNRNVSRDWRKVEKAAEPDLWIIRDDPGWRLTKLRDGELFFVPYPQSATTKRERRPPSPERAAYVAARASCTKRGIEFPYCDFTEFLRDVGERPPGEFLSGRSTHALFRRDDGSGRYEWREKTKGNRQ